MIWATCVVESVAKNQDTLTLECWAILERPPFLLGCERTLRQLLVLHNQVVLQRQSLLLRPPLVMQTTLALWIQHRCPKRLSQCHPEARRGHCTFGTSVLTPHFWDDWCSSALQNGLFLSLSVLPERPPLLPFTLVNCQAGIFSSFSHYLRTAALALREIPS